jgi:hypothetical protein
LIEIVKGGDCDLHEGHIGEEGLVAAHHGVWKGEQSFEQVVAHDSVAVVGEEQACSKLSSSSWRLLAIQMSIFLWHHWSRLNGANSAWQRKVAQVAGC